MKKDELNELMALLPSNIRNTKEFTTKTKTVLAQLILMNGMDKVKNDGYFFVTNQRLVQELEITEKTIIKILRNLEEHNFISRKAGKRGEASEYIINMDVIKSFGNTVKKHCNPKNESTVINYSNELENTVMNYSNKINSLVLRINDLTKVNEYLNTRIEELEITVKNLSNKIQNYSTDTETDIDIELDKEIDNIYNNININKIDNNIIKEKENNFINKITKEKERNIEFIPTTLEEDNNIQTPLDAPFVEEIEEDIENNNIPTPLDAPLDLKVNETKIEIMETQHNESDPWGLFKPKTLFKFNPNHLNVSWYYTHLIAYFKDCKNEEAKTLNLKDEVFKQYKNDYADVLVNLNSVSFPAFILFCMDLEEFGIINKYNETISAIMASNKAFSESFAA